MSRAILRSPQRVANQQVPMVGVQEMPVLLGNGEVKPMAALLLGDKVGFMSPYLTPLSKAGA
jgi:hypothetical protein